LEDTKTCTGCNETKPLTEFGKHKTGSGGLRSRCRRCRSINEGHIPLSEAIDSTSYLGVYIAERALSGFFDHITRMPTGNRGFDFLCGRGFRIDVKSSCRRVREGRSDSWLFHTGKNKLTDYFLCLAFNDRRQLTPEHVWMIPAGKVNDQQNFTISETSDCLERYAAFKKPLDRVTNCCTEMRTQDASVGRASR
jgi:hypothetical protein